MPPVRSTQQTPRTLRPAFDMHLLLAGYDIRTVHDLLAHADVATTMLCPSVLKDGGAMLVDHKFACRSISALS